MELNKPSLKSSTQNTSECQCKQPLVTEMKASKSDIGSNFELEPDKGTDKGKKVIDVEPSARVAATKI